MCMAPPTMRLMEPHPMKSMHHLQLDDGDDSSSLLHDGVSEHNGLLLTKQEHFEGCVGDITSHRDLGSRRLTIT
ncbi:unnamed protein product [Linum trigynum]|uniref:Uncharacterized protein n=1 Tax=Linum trigynum TaxID=586398 RepID=A0AAV2GJX2_9ROSI